MGEHGTWGDYSMMAQRRAGALYHGDGIASQWAWEPKSKAESIIHWGKSLASPDYRERFVLDGEWVMCDGWWGNGTYYKIDMTAEEIDGVPIPLRGRQHFVKWVIPDKSYVLRAHGILTEESSGQILHFGHTQGYWPPAIYDGKLAIQKWESWWDDQWGTPYQRRVDRDEYLAKGIGWIAGYEYFPNLGEVHLKDYWDY